MLFCHARSLWDCPLSETDIVPAYDGSRPESAQTEGGGSSQKAPSRSGGSFTPLPPRSQVHLRPEKRFQILPTILRGILSRSADPTSDLRPAPAAGPTASLGRARPVGGGQPGGGRQQPLAAKSAPRTGEPGHPSQPETGPTPSSRRAAVTNRRLSTAALMKVAIAAACKR